MVGVVDVVGVGVVGVVDVVDVIGVVVVGVVWCHLFIALRFLLFPSSPPLSPLSGILCTLYW